MLALNATTKSLEIKLGGAVTTTELAWYASYVDIDQSTLGMSGAGAADGVTNGATAVTVAAAPAATTTRKLNYLSVFNADTVLQTVTVQVSISGTKRITFKVSLATGEQLVYLDKQGWLVYDVSGNIKQITSLSAYGDPVSVAHGGTGVATLAAHGLLIGNGTGAVAVSSPGTAGQLLTSNGASADPTFQAAPTSATTASYAPTLANVLNSTADTTTISFSIPANAMADGNEITVKVSALVKNNKGTTGTPAWTFLWGATSSVQSPSVLPWNNQATEFRIFAEFRIQRVGNDVWVFAAGGSAAGHIPILWPMAGPSTVVNETVVITAPTFSSTQTFKINLQLDAADATYYFKPQSTNVTHFK